GGRWPRLAESGETQYQTVPGARPRTAQDVLMKTQTLHRRPSRTSKDYAAERGRSHPLGAHPDEGGVNFAVFSEHATGMDLLLFDAHDATEPFQTITLDPDDNRSFAIWHVYVPGQIGRPHV